MIPRIDNPGHIPAWQVALSKAISSVDELLTLLCIEDKPPPIAPLIREFPMRVPHGFARRMETGNPDDPLLRQVLPVPAELETHNGFTRDPLDEQRSMTRPGLLHKYQGRALLTLTGACAIHCRYCFRRHFPYSEANPIAAEWENALDYLASHAEISEIILSGGDPLILPDNRLEPLTRQLAAIPHLKRLRIHTRLPIVIPERVDNQLLAWISTHPQRIIMVLHCNHPNEIDQSVRKALKKLHQCDVILLNQAVLLGGVNDHAGTLIHLSEALFEAGVLPYYLHQLDKVEGAAHFTVTGTRARELMASVHAALPGYLVPRLVTEVPGLPGKLPLWPHTGKSQTVV